MPRRCHHSRVLGEKPESATAATLKDGWLYTGDMGSFDARSYLTFARPVEM